MLNKVSGNKRLIVQGLIGLLLGRVWIYSINPFAVAYFALTLVERKGRGLVFTAILAGMATQVYGTTFVKYILIMLLLWFLDFLVERSSDVSWSTLLIGIGSGTVTLVLGVTNALLSVNMVDMLLIGVLESIALVALINVFQWGVRFLLYENMDKILDNEELISLLAIISLSLYGLPEFMDGLFSVGTTIMYFIVLYVSYRYGASAGAVAGAAGGILASLTGSTAAAIGLYCLLGIGVGMFRQAGRILSSLAFAVMGFVLAFVFQGIIGIIQKIHQSSSHKNELMIFLAVAFLFSCIFSGVISKGGKSEFKFSKTEYTFAVICGVCTFLMNYINLKLSGLIPSQIFFPLVNGGAIILTSIVSVVIFKEKMNKQQLIGLIGGLVSLILICLL
ncbi:MAG: EamA family transporter [Lachnospiraceae bacterium]|nr:EamA family transporter [Lachnospiraceae bacterium]